MKLVKKSAEYTVYQKRSSRYGVKGADNKWLNGDDKVKILLAECLIKVTEPKAAEPEEAAEETAEEAPEAADDNAEAEA